MCAWPRTWIMDFVGTALTKIHPSTCLGLTQSLPLPPSAPALMASLPLTTVSAGITGLCAIGSMPPAVGVVHTMVTHVIRWQIARIRLGCALEFTPLL